MNAALPALRSFISAWRPIRAETRTARAILATSTQEKSIVTARSKRFLIIVIHALVALSVIACSPGRDRNLWHRDFPKSRSGTTVNTRGELTGYWEGDIAMGSVRAKIENGKITLAIRCDSDGKIVAQASALISVQQGDPSTMILQNDLLSDGDEVCGFRFYKGNRFAFALAPQGILKINFAGTSVSQLTKLADLENAR